MHDVDIFLKLQRRRRDVEASYVVGVHSETGSLMARLKFQLHTIYQKFSAVEAPANLVTSTIHISSLAGWRELEFERGLHR